MSESGPSMIWLPPQCCCERHTGWEKRNWYSIKPSRCSKCETEPIQLFANTPAERAVLDAAVNRGNHLLSFKKVPVLGPMDAAVVALARERREGGRGSRVET